jgi:xanthine/uracil permease
MSGWLKHIELRAKARTGVGSGVLICALVAAVAAVMTFVFLCVTAFVWLAQIFGPVVAGLIVAGLFLVVTVVAVAMCIGLRNRNVEEAKLELAHRHAALLDPTVMRVGLQVANAIGWRRIVPLVAAGVFAAGVAAEWRKERPATDQ